MSKRRFGCLLGRAGALCAALMMGVFVAGCKSGPDPRFADLTEMSNQASAGAVGETGVPSPNPDIIHEGDALTITYADLPTREEPWNDRVKQDGTITLLQNQTFRAAGKSRGELEKEIRETYVPKFFRTMTVTVKKTESTQFYFVGGEVKRPDRQVYISRITVLKAIQSAGDFTDFAKQKKVVLTRANGKRFVINCPKAQQNPELDLEVFPGDKIWVPRRIF